MPYREPPAAPEFPVIEVDTAERARVRGPALWMLVIAVALGFFVASRPNLLLLFFVPAGFEWLGALKRMFWRRVLLVKPGTLLLETRGRFGVRRLGSISTSEGVFIDVRRAPAGPFSRERTIRVVGARGALAFRAVGRDEANHVVSRLKAELETCGIAQREADSTLAGAVNAEAHSDGVRLRIPRGRPRGRRNRSTRWIPLGVLVIASLLVVPRVAAEGSVMISRLFGTPVGWVLMLILGGITLRSFLQPRGIDKTLWVGATGWKLEEARITGISRRRGRQRLWVSLTPDPIEPELVLFENDSDGIVLSDGLSMPELRFIAQQVDAHTRREPA